MSSLEVTKPFVLKADILLVPCAELADDLRRRISFDDGDFTLSHRQGRTASQVVDAGTAALLALFREPRTIVEAVVENSRALGRDPRSRLDELLPHLAAFVETRVLVPADSRERKEQRPRYDAGAAIAGWEIVRCLSFMEDSEIYEVHKGTDMAALKIARAGTRKIAALVENEIDVLRRLHGAAVAPRLIAAGAEGKRPYLILDWVAGVNAAAAAAERRHDRVGMLDLCASVAAAYAALHAHGVLHGDVHPGNVLIGERAVLVDFAYARVAGRPSRLSRSGVAFFFEPEHLAAQRIGKHLPSSAAGEQYAVAALLYLLITGSHYVDFRLEREEMERQAETERPVPFAQRGIPPWPAVEEILFRALEKDPARRYASMAEMAAALAEVRDAAQSVSRAASLTAGTNAFLESTLRSFARGGEMFAAGYPSPPTASVSYGCAGAAVGLLRIAEARGDAALLALADVWRSRAAARIGTGGAYYDARGGVPRNMVGSVTPYHTESGIHAAAAMIAAAMGDGAGQRSAVDAFLRASAKRCARLDVTLGRSGALLAAAMLLAIGDDPTLRAFGSKTMRAIWRELDTHPPLDALPPGSHLGIAHGWAGYLYAALRWCAASGDAPPPRLLERLHELAASRTAKGRGAYWQPIVGEASPALIPGWCNGSAGQLFLFTLAHDRFGDEQWLRLAELCAWNAAEEPLGNASLCCGSAGRAYALLNFYRHTGAAEWLSRARQLANHAAANAAATAQRPNSLWQGELGVAVLVADLASPENARMPFFE